MRFSHSLFFVYANIPVNASSQTGTRNKTAETLIVPNVHLFEGHIACDSASNSEIVIPLFGPEGVVGVLDIDSPSLDRFTDSDKAGLEEFVRILEREVF
jgi:GAF domain-containing protein